MPIEDHHGTQLVVVFINIKLQSFGVQLTGANFPVAPTCKQFEIIFVEQRSWTRRLERNWD